MFCSNCGKMIPDGASICPECGLNLAGAAMQSMSAQQIMKPVELAEPMPIDNGLLQNTDQAADIGNFSYSQGSGQDNSGYGYQQASVQSENGYSYQQNWNPNGGDGTYPQAQGVNGSSYQQASGQSVSGYDYQQNVDQNANGYGYQQENGQNGYTYRQNWDPSGADQPQNTQDGGYYDSFVSGTPEGYRGSSGELGQPGMSGTWIVSLVLGILSIIIGVVGGWAFGVIGSGIGIGLGIAGLIVSINYRKSNGGGAVGGLVTSIVGISMSVVMFLSCAACSSMFNGYGYLGCVGESCNTYSEASRIFRNYK